MIKEIYETDRAMDEALASAVDPETGEFNPTNELMDVLDSLQMRKEELIEQVAITYKNHLAMSEALSAEIAKLNKRKKSEAGTCDFLKNFLLDNRVPIKTARADVAFRIIKNSKTVIDDESVIPDCYYEVSRTVSRSAIKNALKNGEVIDGAHLEDTVSVTIK